MLLACLEKPLNYCFLLGFNCCHGHHHGNQQHAPVNLSHVRWADLANILSIYCIIMLPSVGMCHYCPFMYCTMWNQSKGQLEVKGDFQKLLWHKQPFTYIYTSALFCSSLMSFVLFLCCLSHLSPVPPSPPHILHCHEQGEHLTLLSSFTDVESPIMPFLFLFFSYAIHLWLVSLFPSPSLIPPLCHSFLIDLLLLLHAFIYPTFLLHLLHLSLL